MKRFGALEVAVLASLCGGIVFACAAPEDLDPLVLSEAENRYFSAMATPLPPAPPPGTDATPPGTTPVPPGTTPLPPATAPVPPDVSVPPVTPPAPTGFAPSLAAPAADEAEPADAIPLDQWLGQQ